MKHFLFQMACVVALTALGCGDEPPASDVAPTEMTPDPYFEGEKYILADSHANVVRSMRIVGESEPGIALGFDLDGRVSEASDADTCRQPDLVDPEGRVGIDNQLAIIWPLVEPVIGEAVHALLQGAINEGRVLIIMELTGVDDLRNDDDVTLNLYRVSAVPEVGTFGFISPDQTYYYDYEGPLSTVEHAAIVDGEVLAGPVELQVPLRILDLDYVATVYQGRVRLQIREDGSFDGILGGGFDVAEWLETLYATNAAAEAMLVAPVFEGNADMEKIDGVCTKLSVAFKFEGTTGFVVRDAALESDSP